MEITEKRQNGYLIISIDGDLDASSSIEIDNVVNKAFNDSIYNILINCSKLNYISSAGVGVFVSYIDKLKENDGKFIFYEMHPNVLNVFQILGLDKILKITSNEEEAKKVIDEG